MSFRPPAAAFVSWLCCAFYLQSCGAVASELPVACANQSAAIVVVLPSHLYSFAPALISISGHDLPRVCFAQLTPSSHTVGHSCTPSSSFEFPCHSSTRHLATFHIPAHSMQQLQRSCGANDTTTTTTASSCSFDICIHSDSSSASFAPPCIARLARAMHILSRPTFHPIPVPKRSLSTCPILITGLCPLVLCATLFCCFVLDLTRPFHCRNAFHFESIVRTCLPFAAL
jgi:hypothetical protein